ncbi:MAG: flagellar hook protein FlgE [Planctomycetota bacterium]
MGLSSAMITALTGMSGAETQISVVGNNLANSQTVGFKSSDVTFANQFLSTLSQGSRPTDTNGGTDPKQIGMGSQVSRIKPDFSQGTIEISSSETDLAIQGEGFFIVEGNQGQPLYTRNGIFDTNSENELVSATGNRLLGYGVDESYSLQKTELQPLTIPLSANIAQATENVFFEGNLTPSGEVADTAEVIQSEALEDSATGSDIIDTTRLVDVLAADGTNVFDLGEFDVGELSYAGRKGGSLLTEKTLNIDEDTEVSHFLKFLEDASGIQMSEDIPESENKIPGESDSLSPGGYVTDDGQLRLVSNNGTDNAVTISPSALEMTQADGTTFTPELGFSTLQAGAGQSATADFVVYDSLGTPLDVRFTTVLESRDGDSATYRWFADSGDNDPPGVDHEIAVGTGLIKFDGEGNMVEVSNADVNIGRNNTPAENPLDFTLDFSQLSGFSDEESTLAVSRQDGSQLTQLTEYSVGEDGLITGIFDNGMSRTLGQIRLAQFTNPSGLDQLGNNMYNVAFNSGLPIEGNPGSQGLGTITAGAVELSNTDTGEDLIKLLTASTQYRANSRVISTSQQLLDVLMNMRQ